MILVPPEVEKMATTASPKRLHVLTIIPHTGAETTCTVTNYFGPPYYCKCFNARHKHGVYGCVAIVDQPDQICSECS